MLVEVRCLRLDGRKLTREEVNSRPAHRGQLQVYRRAESRSGKALTTALLSDSDLITQVLPPLEAVQITRWRGADLLLCGFVTRSGRYKKTIVDRQTWWVRVLPVERPTS